MATLEEQNAQLREAIAEYEQKEANFKEMFESMKGRLKETLDEKRDFEIEYLSLQKNFVKARNAGQNAQASNPADKDKLHKLNAAQKKAEDEMQVLREDNALLKRQNDSLSNQFREQAKKFDQEDGLGNLSDDYIDSYKREIENLKQLLEKKDQQVGELLSKNGGLRAYAGDLKEDLEKKYASDGKVMPRELSDAPESLSPRNQKSITEELKKSMERRDEILTNGRIEQLEAETEMLKQQIKSGGAPD